MSLIPDEELKKIGGINLAPMVDFLFLVIAVFATLAVTRTALFDNELNLVKVKSSSGSGDAAAADDLFIVNLSVTKDGKYKWLTEMNEYLVDDCNAIRQEIANQQQLGLIPQDADKTKILLHIDKSAKWEPIAQLIFAVREAGFSIHPVYEPDAS
jgi:biopolymer transport protein ExbD